MTRMDTTLGLLAESTQQSTMDKESRLRACELKLANAVSRAEFDKVKSDLTRLSTQRTVAAAAITGTIAAIVGIVSTLAAVNVL